MKKETFKFEAETSQLLDLMINSMYSKKEVFLRELISNASDALDKLHFEALSNTELIPEGSELSIHIEADEEKRILIVSDNGTGMGRAELLDNIGVIAKSGTKELIEKLKNEKTKDIPSNLIGQFGVGFYSSFMVADKIEIMTRKAGQHEATHWHSTGSGKFTISEGSRFEQGTTVTLHLKPVDTQAGLEDYTKEWVIKDIVNKYSSFVRHPIMLKVNREKEKDGKKEKVTEDERLNTQKAIWLRSKSEVTNEELTEFYRHISYDWTEPLKHIFMKAEGILEYHALLFIPSVAPADLFYQNGIKGITLYSKNVKIIDRSEELIPDFLRFVRGVVDSSDISLNVSREMLQMGRQITLIKKALTSKVLNTLKSMKKKDIDKYKKFWSEFGAVLKEGVTSSGENKDKLAELFLFESTMHKEDLTTLKDYKSRMKKDQEEIYYLSGDTMELLEKSPHLELLQKNGYEVLFFTDPVDEFMIQSMPEFDGKKFKSASKGDLPPGLKDETKESKSKSEKQSKDFADFFKALQKELDEKISEVRLSDRLTTSAVCLVSKENDLSPHIERMLIKNKVNVPSNKRILEINPKHEIVEKMKLKFDKDPKDLDLGDNAKLLFGLAQLAEGAPLSQPCDFATLVSNLMVKGL